MARLFQTVLGFRFQVLDLMGTPSHTNVCGDGYMPDLYLRVYLSSGRPFTKRITLQQMLASFRQRPNLIPDPDRSPTPSDEQLVQQVQHDAAALGLLYDRYARFVYTTALRSLRDVASAEDLTQDVFLSLQRGGYDPRRGSLASYLSLLTRSRAIDRLRSQSTRHKYTTQLAQQPQRPLATPMDYAHQQERHARVREALDQLSSDQRQVLELSYYEGQSQSEIATHLGVPLGTVKSWARRGLLKLRSQLQAQLSEEQL